MLSHYSRNELYHSIIFPKIIHYAGMKPWVNKDWYLSQIWWQIFDYLQLPRTSIFKDATEVRKNKKYTKYKRLFNIFLSISSLLLLTVIILSVRIFLQ